MDELPIQVDAMKELEPLLDAVPGLSSSHLYSLVRQAIAGPHSAAPGGLAPGQAPSTTDGSDYAERLTERLLAEAVAICRGKGYPVFAILVGLQGERLKRVQSLFQVQNVPFFMAPDKTERPEFYFKVDGHWNAAGHAFVARGVFEQLLALNLIPAR